MEEKIRAYLRHLEAGDYPQLISLFSEEAIVHSPLYGRRPARAFYRELLADTASSRLELSHIYYQPGGRRAAAHFTYEWALAGGQRVAFDCVDLFEWDEQQHFTELRIIYDASQTRPALESQRNKRG